MITCSRCGEVSDDGAEVCSFCKHRFTASEKEKADRIAAEFKPVIGAMREHKKRTRRGIMVMVISVILLFAIAYLYVCVEIPHALETVIFVVWFVASAIGMIWSRYNICPWCGCYMNRKHIVVNGDAQYCRYCGKQIALYGVDWDKEV